MDVFYLSILAFIGAVTVHVIVHRMSRTPIAALIAYPIGIIFLIVSMNRSAYPLTAVVLYVLLVTGYLLFFLSFLNDAQSPSAKMLTIIRARGPVSEAGIVSHFNNEELIGMRLKRLIGAGWIAKRGQKFAPTRRGALIAGIFRWYRHLLGWDEGG